MKPSIEVWSMVVVFACCRSAGRLQTPFSAVLADRGGVAVRRLVDIEIVSSPDWVTPGIVGRHQSDSTSEMFWPKPEAAMERRQDRGAGKDCLFNLKKFLTCFKVACD